MKSSILKKYNFWEKTPENLGVIRSYYLDKIIDFSKQQGMIVITGARRVGKSVLIKQFIRHLHINEQLPKENILYFNFFIRQLNTYRKEENFFAAIEDWQSGIKKNHPSYIVVDEVQELELWDELIASLIEDHTITSKIIIAGSNSQLLSTDATTKLSGRYYTLNVYPFSYEEFSKALKLNINEISTFEKFVQTATTPEAIFIENNETKENLIEGIVNTTIQKDIIERYNPKSPALLSKILEFIRLNSSMEFVTKKIKDTLNNQVKVEDKIGLSTVETYISYLKSVYFCHECPTFSYRKKNILERSNNKIYLNDWGMALYLQDFEFGRILENIIYMELLKKGYDVKTYLAYQNTNKEIDFWAKKQSRSLFIQVVWMMGDPKENKTLYDREFGNLSLVKTPGEKIIVSMDNVVGRGDIVTMKPHEFILQL